MEHILKYTEWEINGKWYCTDISSFSKGSGLWYHIPNMLNISYIDYIYLLKDKYYVTYMKYKPEYNVLIFAFDSLALCRKFKNDMNKIAREKNFYIY